MKLVTERLSLQSITVEDWPLFLRLYQDPEVIRYISDPRSEAEIRTRFESGCRPGTNTASSGCAW